MSSWPGRAACSRCAAAAARPDVHTAIRASRAMRILVANLMTEPGETDDYSVLEHVLID